jgi:hypothetical protein
MAPPPSASMTVNITCRPTISSQSNWWSHLHEKRIEKGETEEKEKGITIDKINKKASYEKEIA